MNTQRENELEIAHGKKEDRQTRPTFGEAYRDARAQIDEGRFFDRDKPMLEVIYKVMADVYMQNEAQHVTIDGEEMTIGQVKEIYRLLTFRHVEHVISAYRNNEEKIVSARRYLRSMLYITFFELDARAENDEAMAHIEASKLRGGEKNV